MTVNAPITSPERKKAQPSQFEHHELMVGRVHHAVPVDQWCYALAMLAKQSVFRAQDALRDAPEPIATKMGRRLQKIRNELEALDRDWRRAREGVAL